MSYNSKLSKNRSAEKPSLDPIQENAVSEYTQPKSNQIAIQTPYMYIPPSPTYDPPVYVLPGRIQPNLLISKHRFIMKIYTILSLQLILTFGITLLFVTNQQIKSYVQHSVPMLITAIFSSFVFLIILICCNRIAKIRPWNYIFLTLFTLSEGYMIGVTSTYYSTSAVMMALIITIVVTIGLTLFACQTKYDFTGIGSYLFCALLSLIGFGFINAIFCGVDTCQILNTVYALAGALIFSLYIVYDTQIIISGNHRYAITEDEHIFAALTLYLDIINLFLYILELLGALNNDD